MIYHPDILKAVQREEIYTLDIDIADDSYELPHPDWLLNEMATSFESLSRFLGTDIYKKESNDCDDSELMFMGLARALHHRMNPGLATLAVGWIWFKPDASNVGHAINCSVVNIGGERQLFIQDPQTPRKRMFLSTKEKEQCKLRF